MKVVIYDSLSWFWRKIPKVVHKCQLYLTGDFFGVRERVSGWENAVIVPSMVSTPRPIRGNEHVLLNLGGLQNPQWEFADGVKYARSIIAAVEEVLPDENLVVAASRRISEALGHPRVRNYPRSEMHALLENASMSLMTPGLGNILDAAKFGLRTVWLPPANDSQGQQLEWLRQSGCCDAHVDWSRLKCPVDYHQKQAEVLRHISEVTQEMPALHSCLVKCLSSAILDLEKPGSRRTPLLLDLFGTGGAEKATDYFMKKVGEG